MLSLYYDLLRFPLYMAGCNENLSGSPQTLTLNQQREDSSSRLRDVLRSNRQSGKGGIYAVCSAYPAVIEAAVQPYDGFP